MKKGVKKSAKKTKQKKPVTWGDLYKENGITNRRQDADMPVAEWLEKEGMPSAARVFRYFCE